MLYSFFIQPCVYYTVVLHTKLPVRIRVEKKGLTLQLFQPFPALCATWASLLVTISRFGLWVGEWKRRMKGAVFDDDGDCERKEKHFSAEQSSLYRQIGLN